jgi:molybdenum cofactor cytidylyltransferase
MVGSVLATGSASGLEPIVVVSGFHSDQVSAAVGDSAVIAHNEHPELGNMSSLLVGIDAIGDVDGVVVLLADMPRIQSDVIADLVDGVARSGARCGWVEYANGRGHPIVLSRAVFDEVRQLTGTKALWPFLSALPDSDVVALHVSSPKPIDVNTPADYHRAQIETQRTEAGRA